MNILKSRNLSLRALEPEDLELLYLWENDTSIWHLSNTLIPFSRFMLKQYLENSGKDIFELKQLRLIIQLNAETRAIGAIDLFDFDPFHKRAGIGILIADPSQRRKGYAQEALETLMDYCFGVLGLHQLYCNIGCENTQSLKLFTGAGFTVIGEKTDWLFNGSAFENEWMLQKINPATRTPESQPGN